MSSTISLPSSPTGTANDLPASVSASALAPGSGSGSGSGSNELETAIPARSPMGSPSNGTGSGPRLRATTVAGPGSSPRPIASVEKHDPYSHDPTLSPPLTTSMPELNSRLTSTSLAPSEISLSSTADNNVSPKRQLEFERYFRDRLALSGDRVGPDDLAVIATQSADLQAKILIHGRLYLTRTYLCFRANILGYRKEKIHRVKDMVVVEKSTTAKWIQNAISVTMDPAEQPLVEGEEGEGKMFGYGSMADRDAMYESLLGVWKEMVPERYEAMTTRARASSTASRLTVSSKSDDLETLREEKLEPEPESDSAVPGETPAAPAVTVGADGVKREDKAMPAKESQCTGEHYKELATDTKLPLTPQQLFELLYHTPEFTKDFLENTQKLTDVKVTDWRDVDDGKIRDLTYVMHMNNRIGPSKSNTIGTETIIINNPQSSYEVKSTTQTPDVPSGKSFKIVTRTCITHSILHKRPAARLYCTTQCDWSASSFLKSTITPMTIKGQEQYHHQLVGAIRKWIKAHPEQYASASHHHHHHHHHKGTNGAVGEGGASGETDTETDSGSDSDDSNEGPGAELIHDAATAVSSAKDKSLLAYTADIFSNPVMMALLGILVVSLAINYYVLFVMGGKTTTTTTTTGVVPARKGAVVVPGEL